MSQNEQILDWLRQGRSITPREAILNFNCYRLAARISELRDRGLAEGFRILTFHDEDEEGKRKPYARYVLMEKGEDNG